MTESEMIEFKEKLNEKLEKEVVAFLNTTHGGSLLIGVSNSGDVVGVDDIDSKELEIKDRIKNNIAPSAMGLFELVSLSKDGRDYIQIIISGGNQRPYYIRKYGMSPEGCYFRIGTSAEKMSEDMIMTLFQKRDRRTLTSISAPNQSLSFRYLVSKYEEKGYSVEGNLFAQLEFFTPEGKYNLLSYLMSDQNSLQFQYARYSGSDVFDLVEQKTFSNQSILKTAEELLDYLQGKNSTFTQITSTGREDRQKFNPIALREIVVNALVHNDYRSNGMPTFEEFSNRFEISSFGGLPEGFNKEDFLNGYSLPFNPELIRIFRDLGFAERLGTGIRRVLKYYPKEIFYFSKNFIRVNIPFLMQERKQTGEDSQMANTILEILRQKPEMNRKKLAIAMGVSESTIYREMKRLENAGMIRHVGSTKNGYWEVIQRPEK
ncbi:MAG: putative DNA binding domain-containing protein [Spirochaetales bacterium]|nr:putative DNA binding domain-containing protein [Spirochaetales bacterium]MBQ9811194.1 putative DNA binding domain-containing protein [Spirochaetales bacterium]MBR0521015.1 putative DNA binding domain-containing protein [Spirochaetales bacterium]